MAKRTYIKDSNGDKVYVKKGSSFVLPTGTGPDEFEGFWSHEVDLPDYLPGYLLGVVQKVKSDKKGQITWMDTAVVEDYYGEPSPDEQTTFGIELFNQDDLEQFVDGVSGLKEKAMKGKSRKGNKAACKRGEVLIHRDAYTRSDGTRVAATEYCAEDQGKPGITSRGAKEGPYSGEEPWITREGKLGGSGYTKKPAKTRHAILNRCVEEYGYRSCLGSLEVLLRNEEISAKVRKVINDDVKWLKNKYGGEGSFGPESNPRQGNGHGHGHGCPCPKCRGRNPNPELRQLKNKLLR